MPQLVKGGKYVFGWSVVGKDGRVLIPEEARREYQIRAGERVFLLPASKTSGGFSVVRKTVLEQSRLSDILIQNPDLTNGVVEEGVIIDYDSRSVCWATMHEGGYIQPPLDTLEVYGVEPGDWVLAIRGSYIGVGMAVKGPLIAEAKKHPELAVYQL